MKTILEKAIKEREKAKKLSEYAFDLPMEQAIEIRKKQDESFKKFQFYKKLNQAMCELDKEGNNEKRNDKR